MRQQSLSLISSLIIASPGLDLHLLHRSRFAVFTIFQAIGMRETWASGVEGPSTSGSGSFRGFSYTKGPVKGCTHARALLAGAFRTCSGVGGSGPPIHT